MNLWTEYEGRTIDGTYPLTKLIRPEGRSAFFSTSNGTGVPTVIRLIESHFDGDEILTRWRGVAALNHPNLVKLKSFGHVVVDETSLVYAVMEPVEANLSEILRERRLTEPETRQIATSLLEAIETLHSNGFVHEHVLPENVLAVGEVIKLRSDCIRETLEGEEGVALKRKDVRDYATILLQALTQQRTLDDASRALPGPFEQIVRKGISGEWGVKEIGTALKKPSIAQARELQLLSVLLLSIRLRGLHLLWQGVFGFLSMTSREGLGERELRMAWVRF
jgi:eukaryotic-like serine/threonine-protein kinase